MSKPIDDASPMPAADGPWQLLRDAGACLHPAVAALQARVDAEDGTSWLAAAVAGNGDGSSDARLVADALFCARRAEARAPTLGAGPDREVLPQIWSILAEHAPAPAAELAAAALAALDSDRVAPQSTAKDEPRRVGRYELLRPIGIGASGTVHEGRHGDNGLHAAVKLLRLDAWDPVQVERFREEARIIARLEHPSIVKVLDSGVEEIGGFAVPYLVSELVRGRRFTQATTGWPLTALLRTFAAVCDAVVHAHERGVLHRDLKSSNVLVDDAGIPHLLDFGIARMVEERGACSTQTGLLLGTPTAMSPEQAGGAAVDACSEVWSLGALLFESLTGVPPHDLEGLSGIAALRRVAEAEPRRLEALRPDLPRDVLAVLGKALAGNRHDRYATVQLLLDDVHRLAAGDPVSARPPTLWRALGHLARRHRLLAVSATIVLATVIAGIVAISAAWLRAEQARVDSVAAMERTLGFAGRLVEMATPSAELRRLLEDSLAPVADQDVPSSDDARLRVEARLREYLGDLEHRSGKDEEARRQRQRCLELERSLQQRGSGNRSDLARALIKLADLDRVRDPDAAGARFVEAHELLAAIAAEPNATLPEIDDLGWSQERLAVEAIRRKDWPDAERLLTERIDLARRLLARQSDGLRHYALASGLLTRVDVINESSTVPGTDPRLSDLYREACDHCRAAIDLDPERMAFLEKGVAAHIWRATHQLTQGQPGEAIVTAECTRPWLRALRQIDPSNRQSNQLELSRLRVTAASHSRRGDHGHAAEQYSLLYDALGEPWLRAAWEMWPPGHRVRIERDAWLAGWQVGDEALLREVATGLLDSLEHLSTDSSSTTALATLAQWHESRDPSRAVRLLLTARQFLAGLPVDEPSRAAADAAVTQAARALGEVPARR
ncbi:MAG: protein kinase [Planctomycetes bacterium]|nr:protein kinase [Planctomycetota bacterium]